MPALHQIGFQIQGDNHKIFANDAGLFQQNNLAYGTAVVGAGTYTLPDNGLPMYVQATGTAVIQSAAAATVTTLVSGETELFLPLSATTWATPGTLADVEASLASTTLGTGFIPLPLTGWREVFTNDIGVAAVAAAQGSGGILATDTTPTLEYTNGDTNSTLRMLWATSNVDPIVQQVTLPPDLDPDQPIVFHAAGIMSGATNTPVLSLDSYFFGVTGDGGTKVEDDTNAFVDAADAVTATIAAADVIAGSLTIEITPGAHAADTLAIFSTWLTYTRTF